MSTTPSREEMIQYIAETWTDGIDIKDYLKFMFSEYSGELEGWTDKDIKSEYKELTEE
jgi:hypothetical protein